MNKALIWVGVILAGLFTVFMLTAPTTEEPARNNTQKADPSAPAPSAPEEIVDESTTTRLLIGDSNAPVTLIEYGDFKCPSCGQFHQVIGRELRDKYVASGQLNIEFRNFPFIGPDSGRAARGTYCAHEQGAFVDYHDVMYEYLWDTYYSSGNYAPEFDDIYTVDKIIEVAGSTVSDPEKLRSCISSTVVDSKVDDDVALAQSDGIQGTPGFVFNGQKINGSISLATFETLINSQL